MSRALWVFAAALALVSARPADACSCEATKLEDVARRAEVIVYADVGAARAEANGAQSSPITIVDVVRGPRGQQRVTWVKPDGASCHMTDLRPGKWLLFLSWSVDGALVVGRCDQHSRRLKDSAWPSKRKELVAHLGAVTTEGAAVEAAARAVRRLLVASMVGQPGTGLITQPLADLDLARVERAQTTREPDGTFVVRWSQHPPAGFAIDAEVRVHKDGVTEVTRASASFSPD